MADPPVAGADTLTDGVADAPDSFGEAKDILLTTLGDMWHDIIAYSPTLIIGLLLLLAVGLIAGWIGRGVRTLLHKRHLRNSLVELGGRFTKLLIWAIGLLVVLSILIPGLSPASALGGLGVLSIAIGFAFQDIFENFFAGVLLLWNFPFEKGDYIRCESIEGQIQDITIRNTLIRQTDGELVVVPNSLLFKNPVDVLTHEKLRRVKIMVGVSYDTDLPQAITVITDAVKGCTSVDASAPVQVFAQAFGESSIDIEVAWWTAPKPVDHRSSRHEIVLAIKQALDSAGIEIPFPYRTLTFKEALPLRREPANA